MTLVQFFTTEEAATAFARKSGAPNAEYSARRTVYGWVPLVVLRGDQRWMEARIRERGCLTEVRE